MLEGEVYLSFCSAMYHDAWRQKTVKTKKTQLSTGHSLDMDVLQVLSKKAILDNILTQILSPVALSHGPSFGGCSDSARPTLPSLNTSASPRLSPALLGSAQSFTELFLKGNCITVSHPRSRLTSKV